MKIVWHSCHLYWCDPVLFSLRNWRRIQSIRYKNIPGRKWPAQRTEKALYKNILIINSQSIGKLMMWMLHKTFKLSCSSSPLILLPWSFSVMGRQQLKITSYKNSIKSQLQKKKPCLWKLCMMSVGGHPGPPDADPRPVWGWHDQKSPYRRC